jgi:hypothetical protein
MCMATTVHRGGAFRPIVMGHEAAGTVAAIGDGVRDYKGRPRYVRLDRVLRQVPICKRGLINFCDNRQVIGVSCGDYRRHGAFAEYVAVPQRILYSACLPISFAEAAMLEAVSVALHAVRVSQASGRRDRPGHRRRNDRLAHSAGCAGRWAAHASSSPTSMLPACILRAQWARMKFALLRSGTGGRSSQTEPMAAASILLMKPWEETKRFPRPSIARAKEAR